MLFSCISLFFLVFLKPHHREALAQQEPIKELPNREFSYTELTLIRSRILPTNILLSPSQGERGGGLYD